MSSLILGEVKDVMNTSLRDLRKKQKIYLEADTQNTLIAVRSLNTPLISYKRKEALNH